MISHRGRGKRLLDRLLCRLVTARANISLFISERSVGMTSHQVVAGKGIDREVEAVGQESGLISENNSCTSMGYEQSSPYNYGVALLPYHRHSLSRKRVVLARILLLSGWQTGISPRAAD